MSSSQPAEASPIKSAIVPAGAASGGREDALAALTGSGSSTASPNASPKKPHAARRQTAFYPNMNNTNKPLNPFSRSAAKRESVMALGSIEHLQHYFTKTGLAAKENPLKRPNNGLVPAIGGALFSSSSSNGQSQGQSTTITEEEENGFTSSPAPIAIALPPSPTIPVIIRPPFPHVERDYEIDPENLKPGVIQDLEAVVRAWGVDADVGDEVGQGQAGTTEGTNGVNGADSNGLLTTPDKGKRKERESRFDVLSTLKLTTRAIRSVRNYLVSLPDDKFTPVHAASTQQFRRSFSPASQAAQVHNNRRAVSVPLNSAGNGNGNLSVSGTGTTGSSAKSVASDHLTRVRKSALEVLTVLRALEESARLPLTDDAYDAQSDQGSSHDASSQTRSPHRSPQFLEEDKHLHDDGAVDAYHDADTSIMFSLINIPGRPGASVPVWLDDEDEDDFPLLDEEATSKREAWDERLVLGGGWLYKQDIRHADLVTEREKVKAYLDAVDEVIFGGEVAGERGWRKAAKEEKRKAEKERTKGRRASSGGAGSANASGRTSPEAGAEQVGMRSISPPLLDPMRALSLVSEPDEIADIIDDEDLPQWAKRSAFPGDPLGRTHALLVFLLPTSLLHLLPQSSNLTWSSLAESLSSGQLLCNAYNTGVRRSRKPWGYINSDSIHDVAALKAEAIAKAAGSDEKGDKRSSKTGWTFRRTDNLRLWGAALKIRYMLPLINPSSQKATSKPVRPQPVEAQPDPESEIPTRLRFPTIQEVPIHFDAKAIARKDEGWETMLRDVVNSWVDVVVEERRGER